LAKRRGLFKEGFGPKGKGLLFKNLVGQNSYQLPNSRRGWPLAFGRIVGAELKAWREVIRGGILGLYT